MGLDHSRFSFHISARLESPAIIETWVVHHFFLSALLFHLLVVPSWLFSELTHNTMPGSMSRQLFQYQHDSSCPAARRQDIQGDLVVKSDSNARGQEFEPFCRPAILSTRIIDILEKQQQ